MKIEMIKLKGYIGIYNGLGLYEICIDFTKCLHKIILIKGENGSGKSTIMRALSPLPDDNSEFISGQEAEKEIIINDYGIIYKINFFHPVKNNGDRDTTKAYIKKNINGDITELNPNGNISSFKDILYSEFNLDPNFVALSQLSGTDRGLADKKPYERKRFVSPIVGQLEVYNNINKALTKRSSIFKSMINNLTSKIDSIGDENKVKLTLESLENRINNLNISRTQLVEQIAGWKSTIAILDPNSAIQNLYEEIYNKLMILNGSKDENDIKIKNCINRLRDISDISEDNVMKYYKDINDLINSLSVSIQIQESEVTRLLSERENDARILQTKVIKLNSLKSESNYLDIENEISKSKEKIIEYEKIFSDANIKNAISISKDEYITGLNILKDIKETIDVLKAQVYSEVLNEAITYILNNDTPDIETIEDQIDGIKEVIELNKSEFKKYEDLYNKSSALILRPKECCIDSCRFIEEALDAHKMKPLENMEKLSKLINDDNDILESLINNERHMMNVLEVINNIKIIFRYIDNYHIILNKLPNGNIFTDKKRLLERIKNHDTFEDINDLYKFIEYSNIFDEYKIEKQKLNDLKSDYKLYQSKNVIIDEIVNDIDDLNNNLNKVTGIINENNITLQNNKLALSKANDTIIQLDILISLYNEKSKLVKEKNELTSQFNNIRENMIKIKENINNINNSMNSIKFIDDELKPLLEDRDTVKHSLTLLKEYVIELQDYNARYQKIEDIKYYSSPNTGIQTVFMELYMNKIIVLANELLSLLFGGEFVLEQFIINEKEFRIPCQGNGLRNDDISSMSTSQICLISMILSFAILAQSSTKYNILKLDEIDGGLDTTNRLQFLNVLDKLIDILDVEQCIMISHNTEIDFSNVDLIILKIDDSEGFNEGNVIYRY